MKYIYEAKNIDGLTIKGEIDASNQSQAIKTLKERKLIIFNLSEKKDAFSITLFEPTVSLKEKFIFVQQLSVMIRSGLSLIEALEGLREQTSNKKLSKTAEEISIGIRGGKSFSDCLKSYPKIFSPIFINTVSSGEKSGKLDDMLDRLSIQMEKDYELQSKVQSAMMYPIVILVAIFGVMLIVLFYIMPQVKKIFDEMSVSLPLITQFILALSEFIIIWWWAILGIIIGAIFAFIEFNKIDSFREKMDLLKLKIPIYGVFLKKLFMARFSRNMSTLISSGLSMIESLESTKGMMTNIIYQKSIARIIENIEGGFQLSGALRKEKEFPIMVSQMISVGEKSGKLDFVLNSLADFFDKEVETTTKNLSTILEPVITILLGIGVALVVVSVLQPIYSLVDAI